MIRAFSKFRRTAYGVSALALTAAVVGPSLMSPAAFAFSGSQLQTRSIEMSNSTPGATGVQYLVTFTPQTTEASGDIVIMFCANDPLDGDNCTATAGTDTPDFTSAAGTGVAKVGDNGGSTNYHTVKITSASLTSGSAYTATITGVKNPTNVGTSGNNSLGTFYARIYTFATGGSSSFKAQGDGATAPTTTGAVDFGGLALSTASNIGVTAKVMETLSFCVYLGTATCGTDPSFQIGAGPNGTLDTTSATKTTKLDLSTNAKSVSVRLQGDTLSNAGNGHSFTTTPTLTTPSAGTENFGVDVSSVTSLSADSAYDGTGGGAGKYALDLNAVTGIKSTFGEEVVNSSTPVNSAHATLTWQAQASNTTPAGIYTANEHLIATGTF